MASTKVKTENIMTLDAAKITGAALPALNGAALTNIPGVTNSASDPTISTNPSAVGAVVLNTTSGELFVCTDATAGVNFWINVGTGEGAVGKSFGGQGGGTVAGYVSGGEPSGSLGGVEKFTFASSNNATSHGNLSLMRGGVAGASSVTHGFTSGGYGSGAYRNTIDKWAI